MMLGSGLPAAAAGDPDSPNNVKTPNRQRKPSTPRRSLAFENNENNPPQNQIQTKSQHHHDGNNAGTPKKNSSVDIRKMQSMFKTAAEENIRSIRAYVTELKERVAKLQYQKQLLVCQVKQISTTYFITVAGSGFSTLNTTNSTLRIPC
jgi:centromeric protein E